MSRECAHIHRHRMFRVLQVLKFINGVFTRQAMPRDAFSYAFFLTSFRRPIFTVKTSTYHFCKMSLVKSPSFTHSVRLSSSCETSDVEPPREGTEENTESHVVNPTEGSQEHGEGILQSPW